MEPRLRRAADAVAAARETAEQRKNMPLPEEMQLPLPRRLILAAAAGAALAPRAARADARGIALVVDPADAIANAAPAQWATGLLRDALSARGNAVRAVANTVAALPGELRLVVAGAGHPTARAVLAAAATASPQGHEALALVNAQLDGAEMLLAAGTDARGVVYALTELLDRIATEAQPGEGLRIGAPLVQHPANRVRSIARCFESEVEDKTWLHDREFWRDYLTMLVTQRFNRFSLTLGLQYNYPMEVSDVFLYFAYPFLLAVPGYDVRARGLSDEERDRNLASLKFIAAEAGRRGLDFQLGLWTHAYRYDSPRVNYLVEGMEAQTHAAYCADALSRLLTDIPEITGVTLRIHGESGIPEGDFDFWRTVFRGIVRAGRPIEIDMHAKGIDQTTIDLALQTGLPVKLSPKYLGEHIGLPYHESAIRETDRARPASDAHFALSEGTRRFTRYGYADFLREDRKYGIVWRVWPGTQRVLAWADPVLFAGYGRQAGFCGADGIEICEPMSFRGRMGSGRPGNRTGYVDRGLVPPRDFQKFAAFYRMWGRLTYDPAAPAESWRRASTQSLGAAALPMEQALASASRILPLVTLAHGPSASNNSYWPEMYRNMPIVQESAGRPYYDTPMPGRFATVESFDPQMFATIEQTAAALIAGTHEPRLTPIDVAALLEDLAGEAASRLEAARSAAGNAQTVEFRRLAVDVGMLAGLGRFFAAKFRAALLWSVHLRGDERTAATEALKSYRAARDRFADVAKLGAVYEADLAYGPEPWLRGHWRDRLVDIDHDITEMARLAQDTNGFPARRLVPQERLYAAIGQILAAPSRDRLACRHFQPASFTPGKDLALSIVVPAEIKTSRLHYRHVNQAEGWVASDMAATEGRRAGVIPAAYLTGTYPLQYYFELASDDAATLFPGLDSTLANVPYYVVRPAGAAEHV